MNGTTVAGRWQYHSARVLSILRIVTGFLFLQYGTAKLFALPGPLMPGGGTAHVASLPWFAGILEAVGGFLVTIGLFTRPVAFIISGEMAFAYLRFHAPRGFWPILNQGIPAIFFCFLWLYFSAAGPGPWSLDALRRRK